ATAGTTKRRSGNPSLVTSRSGNADALRIVAGALPRRDARRSGYRKLKRAEAKSFSALFDSRCDEHALSGCQRARCLPPLGVPDRGKPTLGDFERNATARIAPT